MTTDSKKPEQTAKKPYVAPRLRYVGKVRDLTLAGAGSVTDGVLMQMAM
jgi:hypothetical protein